MGGLMVADKPIELDEHQLELLARAEIDAETPRVIGLVRHLGGDLARTKHWKRLLLLVMLDISDELCLSA